MIYFSGIDIGTTAVKAAAFSSEGKLLSLNTVAYATSYPRTDWAEQSADTIWRAVRKAIIQMLTGTQGQLYAASFSCAMHGLLGLDNKGKALTPVLIWSDLRSKNQASNVKKSTHAASIYRCSGAPIHPMLPLCKLIWQREEQPDVFAKVRYWVSIKDYIIFKLTGEWLLDYSMAAATGLYDHPNKSWNNLALDMAGINHRQLSALVSPDCRLPALLPRIQKQTGLPSSAALYIGSSDGCLANVGSGAIHKGYAAMTVGTSAAFRVGASRPVYDPNGLLFCYPLPYDVMVVGGASNNAGNVWQWATRLLNGKEVSSNQMAKYLLQAAQLPPGAEGLRFLPYLAGERAPISLDNAQGAFLGFSMRHGREHLLRAVLEGILFNLRLIGEKVQDLTQYPIDVVRLSGGLAKSAFFAQLTADVFGKKVELTQTEELSAFGAALLAMQACGAFNHIEDAYKYIVIESQYQPNVSETLKYNDYFVDFQKQINTISNEKNRFDRPW